MPSGNYGLVSSSSSSSTSSSSSSSSGYSEAEERQRIIAATSQGTIGAKGTTGATVSTGGRTFAVSGSADSMYTADQGRTYSSTALGAAEAAKREEGRAQFANAAAASSADAQRKQDYETFTRLQASGASREELQPLAAKLSASAATRTGAMRDPYTRDASGTAWTEPMLETYADPTQAAALRYAAATGKPRPTVTRRTTDEVVGESVVFLPEINPKPAAPITNRTEYNEAAKEVERKSAISAAQGAASTGWSIYASKEREKLDSKWAGKTELTDAEAYEYTTERNALENRLAPIDKNSASLFVSANKNYADASKLSTAANASIPQIRKEEAEAADWHATEKKRANDIGAGYNTIPGYANVRDRPDQFLRTDSGEMIRIPSPGVRLELSPNAMKTVTYPLAGFAVGGPAGAVAGEAMALGEIAGGLSAYTTEGDVKPKIVKTNSIDTVRGVKYGRDVIGMMIGKGPVEYKRPTVDEYFAMSPEEAKPYRYSGKAEEMGLRTAVGSTVGSIIGAGAGEPLNARIEKVRTTPADSVFGKGKRVTSFSETLVSPEGVESRQIIARTQGYNWRGAKIEGATKTSVKAAGELDTLMAREETAKLTGEPRITKPFAGKDVTVSEKVKVFGTLERQGSPKLAGAEVETTKSSVVDVTKKSFLQSFETKTSAGGGFNQGETTARGVGGGLRGEDTVAGKNWGILERAGDSASFDHTYITRQMKPSPGGGVTFTGGANQVSTGGGTTGLATQGLQSSASQLAPTSFASSAELMKGITPTAPSQTGTLTALGALTSTSSAPPVSTGTMRAAPAGEAVQIQKTRHKDSAPSFVSVTTSGGTGTSTVVIPGSRQRTGFIPTMAQMQVPGTGSGRQVIPSQITVPAVVPAQRTNLIPTVISPTVPPGIPSSGFGVGTPPPIFGGGGGGLNIPLGVFERDQIGGAGRGKTPKPRYAPSVTASVYGISTTKKQKASGWTGLEVRPLVIPKKGTIIEHPYVTSDKKKEKSAKPKGADYAKVSSKLGLDFSGLNFGRRTKK
jgi:hypothetical protein